MRRLFGSMAAPQFSSAWKTFRSLEVLEGRPLRRWSFDCSATAFGECGYFQLSPLAEISMPLVKAFYQVLASDKNAMRLCRAFQWRTTQPCPNSSPLSSILNSILNSILGFIRSSLLSFAPDGHRIGFQFLSHKHITPDSTLGLLAHATSRRLQHSEALEIA